MSDPSDLDRRQIEDDLMVQGLEGVTPAQVAATTGLYRGHALTPADLDAYDPSQPPDIYAPTAAEMYPDMVPDGGWPPREEGVEDL